MKGKKRTNIWWPFAASAPECKHIQRFFEQVQELTLRDLFAPISKSPVFQAAQQSGCHPMCPVPIAVLKTAEVTMGMALPKDAEIKFEK